MNPPGTTPPIWEQRLDNDGRPVADPPPDIMADAEQQQRRAAEREARVASCPGIPDSSPVDPRRVLVCEGCGLTSALEPTVNLRIGGGIACNDCHARKGKPSDLRLQPWTPHPAAPTPINPAFHEDLLRRVVLLENDLRAALARLADAEAEVGRLRARFWTG